ncbi:MAG: hypothetical protein AABX40_03845, partial [Candidatus Hydrothermarchaeota archaeon]
GDASGLKSKLGTLDTRLGDLEAKVRGHNTPPGTGGGIVVHFLTIENGNFYPDQVVAYEGDVVRVNIINKDLVDHAFVIDALGGVNIKAPANGSSGVKDIVPGSFEGTRKLNAGVYRFYSPDVGIPMAGGYLVVLRS